jgi:hypothetical protein
LGNEATPAALGETWLALGVALGHRAVLTQPKVSEALCAIRHLRVHASKLGVQSQDRFEYSFTRRRNALLRDFRGSGAGRTGLRKEINGA